MRLFIGLALDSAASGTLRQLCDRFEPAGGDSLRWPAAESWHVTLQFLGETSPEQAVCVAARLGEISCRPVPVRLKGLDFFARAGVFFAGVELTQDLLALQQTVAAHTRRCGFEAEERAYHPHITLARAKGRNGSRALQPLRNAVAQTGVRVESAFIAEEFLLYESVPGPRGSRYEVRARFPLLAN